MRWKLAYNKDFDLYVNAYIEQYNKAHPDSPLPYPIGPDGKPFRWANWFQRTISPKLHVPVSDFDNAEELKDEAIHEMLFKELGRRRILDEFRDKMQNYEEGVRDLDEAKQLTIYLTKKFIWRVDEMRKDILQRMPKDEMSMMQPAMGDEGEEGEEEVNILETSGHGVGEEEYEKAEAVHDVGVLRSGFEAWLLKTQKEKVAQAYLALFDLYWSAALHSGEALERGYGDFPQDVALRERLEELKQDPKKNRKEIKELEERASAAAEGRRRRRQEETPAWMLNRREMQDEWIERTGLSFGSFKAYLGEFPAVLEKYIRTHAKDLGAANPFVKLVETLRPQGRPAKASALALASVEEDVAEARAETESPAAVDKDIAQPTESAEEAAKVATTWEVTVRRGPNSDKQRTEKVNAETFRGAEKKVEKMLGRGEYVSGMTTAAQKLDCCGSVTGYHKPDCPVYNENFDKTMGHLNALPKRGGREDDCDSCGCPKDAHDFASGKCLCGECTDRTVEPCPCPGYRAQKLSSAKKTAKLVSGSDLTPEMRGQVEDAFIYRSDLRQPAPLQGLLLRQVRHRRPVREPGVGRGALAPDHPADLRRPVAPRARVPLHQRRQAVLPPPRRAGLPRAAQRVPGRLARAEVRHREGGLQPRRACLRVPGRPALRGVRRQGQGGACGGRGGAGGPGQREQLRLRRLPEGPVPGRRRRVRLPAALRQVRQVP